MIKSKGFKSGPPGPIIPVVYRVDIQWLRAFAILSVLLYHAGEKIIPNGYLGVDVFFVVSGFVVAPLIERIFLNERISGKLRGIYLFYMRRFWRLAPTMGFVIGVSTFFVILLASPSEHWRIAQQAFYSMIIAGNVGAIKFSGDYFSPTPNPFIHLWSLSVEEQIYFFLPILCLIISFFIRKRVFSLCTLAILGCISFVLFLFPHDYFVFFKFMGFASEVDFVFYSAFTRFWQFAVGAILFLITQTLPQLKYPAKLRVFWILILLLVLFTPLGLVPKSGTVLITLITLLTLIPSSNQVEWERLSNLFVWFGNRSYSIYLVHMPILYFAKYSPVLDISLQESRAIQSVIGVLLSILLGALIHSTVENKSRMFGKMNSRDQKKKLQFLMLSMLIPFGILLILNFGERSNYWGLMHELNKPPYAGDLDPKCKRDSDLGFPCIYQHPSAQKSVLLVGDSHAGHYSQALIEASRNENWNSAIWSQGSCLFDVNPTEQVIISDHCLARNKKVLDWIGKEKPQLIIVSQYVKANLDQSGIRNSLSLLRNMGMRVLIIENNPVFPDEKDYMVARPLLMKPYKPPKSFPISAMNDSDTYASEALISWAKANGIETLKVKSYYCNNMDCKRFDKGEWLYTDDDHLSVAGANKLIPKLSQILELS
jgi:peptidoglycan/LPS O-acetylase OafA/YrhL